jgi:hypothetical protein
MNGMGVSARRREVIMVDISSGRLVGQNVEPKLETYGQRLIQTLSSVMMTNVLSCRRWHLVECVLCTSVMKL